MGMPFNAACEGAMLPAAAAQQQSSGASSTGSSVNGAGGDLSTAAGGAGGSGGSRSSGSSPCTHLCDLPDALLGSIVAAAASGDDTARLRLVCKRLLALHDGATVAQPCIRGCLIKEMVHTDLITTERHTWRGLPQHEVDGLARMLARRKELCNLTLKGLSASDVATLLPREVAVRLRALSIRDCEVGQQFAVLPACTGLQQLTVELDGPGGSWRSLLPHLPALTALRSLRLEARSRMRSTQEEVPLDLDPLLLEAALAPMVHLTHLDVSLTREGALVRAAALTGLTALQDLTLVSHEQDIAALAALTRLERLDLMSGVEAFVPGLLAKLASLSISCSGDLPDISATASLTMLGAYSFKQQGAEAMQQLRSLTGLRTLSLLCVAPVTQAQAQPFSCLTQLHDLFFQGCSDAVSLAWLAPLRQLQRLNIARFPCLTTLESLSELPRLTELDVSRCSSLTSLAPLEAMTQMRKLRVRVCEQVVSLAPLLGLACLARLTLFSCPGVTDLAPVGGLGQLRHLTLCFCSGVGSCEELLALTQLQQLQLVHCTALCDLTPLSRLVELRQLDTSNCAAVTSLQPLSGLSQLTQLDVGGCTGLSSLEPLRGLVQLRELNLSACGWVIDIGPFSGLAQLRKLNLRGCTAITELGPLSRLARLWWLNVHECPDAVRQQAASLTQLRELLLTG